MHDGLTEEARLWLKDCEWADGDAEIMDEWIDSLDAQGIIDAVERHYSGGWSTFVDNASPDAFLNGHTEDVPDAILYPPTEEPSDAEVAAFWANRRKPE